MTIIIVLFNLKDGAEATDYEQWARTTDLPTVNKLESVKKFSVLKSTGLLGGGAAPYQYVEIIDLHSLERLGADIRSEAMRKVAAEFSKFADEPLFIVTEPVE
jgi:hypothetical protein